MTVKQTHKRRTRLNDYRRFCVQDGNIIYWIHTNFDRITWIRKRVEITEDDMKEGNISVLPDPVFSELKQFHPSIQY